MNILLREKQTVCKQGDFKPKPDMTTTDGLGRENEELA